MLTMMMMAALVRTLTTQPQWENNEAHLIQAASECQAAAIKLQ